MTFIIQFHETTTILQLVLLLELSLLFANGVLSFGVGKTRVHDVTTTGRSNAGPRTFSRPLYMSSYEDDESVMSESERMDMVRKLQKSALEKLRNAYTHRYVEDADEDHYWEDTV